MDLYSKHIFQYFPTVTRFEKRSLLPHVPGVCMCPMRADMRATAHRQGGMSCEVSSVV